MTYLAKCGYCDRRRQCYRTYRFGGGSYRRAGRWYSTSICGECATDLLKYASEGSYQVSRYTVSSIRNIAEQHQNEGK